ncbi:MAG: hypothetical protein ISN29_01590, partial [Gammaproteobacteria bacterium AqS3]|nr:hypothetical protein [Gammaproteobacteria bacterium AqS3]
ATGSVSVTVTDDDTVGLTLSPGALTVAEGAAGSFTVKLNSEPSATVTLSVARLAGGSTDVTFDTDAGTAGDQSQLSFTTANWSTVQTVTVRAAEDEDALADSAVLRLTASGGGYSGSEGSVSKDITVTVTEDDAVGLALSPGSLTFEEGANGSFTVALTTQPSDTVTVGVVQTGTANSDVTIDTDPDTSGNQNQLSFTTDNWGTGQSVKVSAIKDDDALADSAVLRLTASGGGYSNATESVSKDLSVTVTERDTADLTLSVSSLTVTEGSSGSFTVALATRPSAAVTVNLSVAGSNDVSIDTASLSFTTDSWSTAQSVTVDVVHDEDSANETAAVSLRAAGGDYEGQTDSVSVRVTDDDTAALTISPGTLTVTEGLSGTFTVVLDTRPGADVTVSLEQPDPGGNSDVSFTPTSLNFTTTNWGTPRSVTVSAIHDDDAARDTATINLSAAGGGYGSATGSVSVTVTDDDTVGLTLSPGALTVSEGSDGSFTVALATEPSGTVTVTVAPTGETNSDVTFDTSAGTAGNQSQMTFTAANWRTVQTVTVRAAEDDDALTDSAALRLTAAGADYAGVSKDILVTVTENDTADLILSKSSLSLDEGASGSFSVELKTRPSGTVTVKVERTAGGSADVTFDTDSVTTGDQGRLSFTTDNWNVAQAVTVSAAEDDDAIDDSAELRLTATGGGYSNETSSVSRGISVTVDENDAVALTLSSNSLRLEEGTNVSFTVKLATRPSAAVTVSLNVTGSSDVTLNASALIFTTDNWSTMQTMTVSAAEDDDAIADVARVSLTAIGGDYTGQTRAISVSVTENDSVSLEISKSALRFDEGASESFTVALGSAPSASVSVSLVQLGISNPDISIAPSSLRFTASNWSTGQGVTVSAIKDPDAIAESATIRLSASGGGYGSATGDVSVSVLEKDAVGLKLSASDLEVDEGAGESFTVALNTQPTSGVTVRLERSGSSDVTLGSTVLNFTRLNWSTAQSVQVNAAEDDDSQDENATISLRAAGGDYGSVTDSISVSVEDNDTTELKLSTDALSVSEGGGESFEVELSTRPSATVTVDLTRTGSSDVTFSPATMSFTTSNWDTPKSVRVNAADDSDIQTDRATITLTASGGDYAGVTDSVSVTVVDSDKVGLVLSVPALTIDEGGSGRFTVKLATQPSANVTVSLERTAGGSTDVTLDKASLSFTDSNWSTAQMVTVSAAQDDDATADSATISVSAAGGDYDGQAGSISVSVTEDDTAALTLSKAALELDEGGDGSFTVQLATQPVGGVTVNLALSGDDDVTLGSPSLVFTSTNWSTVQTVTVRAAHDNDALADRATVSLSASGQGYGGIVASVSVTVEDDDDTGLDVSVNSLTLSEGASAAFTVALDTRPSADVSVVLGQSGSVNPDISMSQVSLDFTPSNWSTPQTVRVSAIRDSDAVQDSGMVSLTASGGDYDDVTGSLDVTVTELDTINLALSGSPLTVDEGDDGSFTVALATRPSSAVSVSLTQPGAGNPDVTLSAASLSFSSSNWNVAQEVTVTAAEDDDAVEDQATINLAAAGGGYDSVTGSVSVNVTDDDVTGLELSEDDLTVVEGSNGGFTVALTTLPSAAVTVTLRQSGTAGPDLTLGATSLSFTALNWDAPQRVTVTVGEDDDALAEQATISLSAQGGDYDGVRDSVSVRVTDNDTPALSLSKNALSLNEGGSGDFTVRLATQPSSGVTVNLTRGGSNDVTLGRTLLSFTTLNWSAPQSVAVGAAWDADAQDDTATISLSAAGGGYGEATGGVTVTVTDSSAIGLVLSERSLSFGEGSSGSFTVRLNTQPNTDVTVRPVQSGTGNSDVTLGPAALDFTVLNWSAPQRVTVSAIRDADAMDDDVTVALTASGGDYAGVSGSVSVTVDDLDRAALALSAANGRLALGEGDSETFTVRLSSSPGDDVRVQLARDGSGDVSVSPVELRFTAGDWNQVQTVTVSAIHDDDAVNDSATVSLTASGGDYAGVSGSVSVTVTDDETVSLELSKTSLEVGEGESESFTVALATQPSADVTVAIVQPANTDVTADADINALGIQESLIFTRSNWDTVRTVLVRAGQDTDALADSAEVGLRASGGDYDGVTARVKVEVGDDDGVGIRALPSPVTVLEGGSPVRMRVALETRPSAPVTLTLSQTGSINNDVEFDTDSAQAGAQSTLNFTQSNWSQLRAVEISANQDADSINDAASILLSAQGGDYVGVTRTVTVSVTDDDKPILVLSESELTVLEGGTASFTAVLSNRPSGDVTVALRKPEGGEVTLDGDAVRSGVQGDVVFTDQNWNQPRIVTIAAGHDDDGIDDIITLSLAVSGGASEYSGASASLLLTVDDDDVPGLSVTPGSLEITEGESSSFSVKLTTEPSSNVVVTIAPAVNTDIEFDTDAGAPGNQGVLHFSPQNWSTARMVRVTALQDVDSQNETETLRLSSSGGLGYSNRRASVEVAVEDDDQPALELSRNGIEISEALTLDEGEGAVIGVRLLSRPSSSVQVTLTSADAGAVAVSPASLSFTQGDWGSAQNVTVTGAQDGDSVDERVQVGLSAAGGDYEGISAGLQVIVEDDETAGLNLSALQLTVVEGRSSVFTVALNHLPVGEVTVALSASDGAAAVSPLRLTFAPDNWSAPQEVSVSGIEDDDTQDAEDAVQLAASGGGYDGVTGRIEVAVQDDDTPSLVLSTPALSVPEGGAASFMVSLATQPGEAVQVSIAGAEASFMLFVPDQLGFTGENWSQPQVVTVLGLNDPNAKDDVSVLSLSGSGADYGGVTAQLEVTVVDDDAFESARPEEIEAAENVLEEIGRTLLGGSVDVITRRFSAPAGGRAEADIGGAEVEVGGEGSFERALHGALQHFGGGANSRMHRTGTAGSEHLRRLGSIELEDGRPLRIEQESPEQNAPLLREFTYPLGGPGGETTAWMRFNRGEFSGELQGLEQPYSGAQDAIWAGIDQRFGNGLLFGAAVSQGAGDAHYAVSSSSERVVLDTDLLMVMPYLEIPVRDGLMNLVLGFGSGDIESRETDGAHSRAHLSVQMFSLGTKWPLARLGERFALSLTGAIGSSRLVTTCSTGDLLCGLSVSSGRLNAGVEVMHEGIGAEGSWSVTPRYALSLRQDSGRQSSGAGVELSSSVRLAAPGDRFSIDAGFRWLGMHAAKNYEEWSGSVEVQLKSRDAAGRGLTLGLGPQWGTLESGALDEDGIFGPGPGGLDRAQGERGAASGRAAMRASAGYGVDLWAGLLTPFAEYSVSGGEAASSRLQGGLRYRSGETLEGRLFGEWEAGRHIQPRSRIGLELNRWF